jgi:hypothetical protein
MESSRQLIEMSIDGHTRHYTMVGHPLVHGAPTVIVRDLTYEANNEGIGEIGWRIRGSGVKCKNHEVCRAILPRKYTHGDYLCVACTMMFGVWFSTRSNEQHIGWGHLPITDALECPICLEMKRSISQPRCEHTVCIDCFRRCNYGKECPEDEPPFPHPDIEKDYYEDQGNPVWYTDYPLIQRFDEDWKEWSDLCGETACDSDPETYHPHCPLCRK